ncbi:MAG: MraY family glycosyltransferase [Wenzhouxiangella sp.]
MTELWRALLAAAVTCAVLGWPLRAWLLGLGLLDQPGRRRCHLTPTPRGGGLAMATALALALLAHAHPLGAALPLLGLVLAVTGLGWLDDVRDLPVRVRLLGQLLIAMAMLMLVGPVSVVEVGGLALNWPWLWSALGLIAVVWLINLHNFMDGADGLAAMQGAWSGLALGVLLHLHDAPLPALAGFALAGACLGFLFWNRPPARLFMGDSGSMMIGAMVGLLALSGAAGGGISIWASLIVSALFVVDATATLARRLVAGQQWYTAHREHAYQRLIAGGWSHGRVLLLYTLINLAVVLPVLLLAVRFPAWDLPLALGLVGALATGWAVVQRTTNKEMFPQ